MTISTELNENLKEEKVNLQNSISLLKKSMKDYKAERKSDWKSFKNKFKGDMEGIEKSLKKLTPHHKK